MLNKKVAIVTGGTRGIGLEIVRTFLNNGANVALLGSKEESVTNAINKLKEENENYQVIGFYPNLASEVEVKETFAKVANEFGHIDILVNNAGMYSSNKIEDYTVEE